MGKKYLETKTGSLEQSILGLWEKAAEDNMDEKYTDDQRRAREKARGKGGRKYKHAPSRTTGHDAGTGSAPGGKERKGDQSKAHAHAHGDDPFARSNADRRKKEIERNKSHSIQPGKNWDGSQDKEKQAKMKMDLLKKKQQRERDRARNEELDLEILELENLINEHKGDKPHKHPHEEKELDDVNPKANKKKFKDRKDKDIDNDGDVDSSDKFLHKRRKAIAKNTREAWEEAYRLVQEKDTLGGDTTPDEDDGDDVPAKKKSKTDTGKKPDEIKMNPDMDEYYKAMKKKK